MNELRWILVGASVVLLVWIYFQGRRKTLVAAKIDPIVKKDIEPPQLHESVTMSRERRREPVREVPISPEIVPRVELDADDLPEVRVMGSASEALTLEAALSTSALEQLTITQPLHMQQSIARQQSDKSEGQAATIPVVTVKPRMARKVVALRVAAGARKFSGAQLKEWLWNHNLRQGKYDIYHRYDERGDTLFSVASMVEPGSFDRDTMETTEYPGLSLFLQLPNHIDSVAAFDDMLACAHELQSDFFGNLYGERNSPLTSELAERMRESITDFEHLVSSPQARA